jgi:hypothetical protein
MAPGGDVRACAGVSRTRVCVSAWRACSELGSYGGAVAVGDGVRGWGSMAGQKG